MHRSITRKLLVSTLGAAVFAAFAALPTAASAATTLRFGHVHVNGELAAELEQEFADRVNQRTKGEVTIKVFPGEQLGKEVDLIQQVKSGALDITTPSMAALSNLVPALEIASAPFLWNDWAQAENVIRGPAFQPIFDLETRRTCTFEALARWTNGELGAIGPNKFIPVAEQCGEIVRLGERPVDIFLAPEARAGNWLPSGGAPQVRLILRLYDTPIATTISAATPMPAVTKQGCP